MRHCTTSRTVVGLIPDGVIGIFSLTQSFRPHCGPGVDSASNRNEYQEYFLVGKGGWCVGLTTLPPSCADCLEIWEPQPPGTLTACPVLSWDCFFNILLSEVDLYTFVTLGCSNLSIVGVNLYLHPKFHMQFDSSKEMLAYDFLIQVMFSPLCFVNVPII